MHRVGSLKGFCILNLVAHVVSKGLFRVNMVPQIFF
jgi:hypothetical protein